MIGVKDGVRRVFLRRLDRAVATELPDTAGANGAVFSPDGGSLAVLFGSGLITRIALADQQRKVLTSGADIGRLDHLESGRHHLQPRGCALDRPAGGRRTARAHRARCRPPRGGARQRGGSARGAPRVVFESDHRPRRRAHRIRVDRRGTARRWWSSGRGLPCGRPLAICSSRGTARCWRWRSTRARGCRAARPSRSCRAGAIESLASGQLGLMLSSTGTLLSTPAGFTDTRVVSVGRDGAALALDLPSGRYAESSDFARRAPAARRKR